MKLARLFLLVLGLVVLPLTRAATPATEPIHFAFALYFSPTPAIDAEQALARLLSDPESRLKLAGTTAAPETLGTVHPHWVPLEDYALPSEESFHYFAIGLDTTDRARMAVAEQVLVLDFTAFPHGALIINRAACTLVANLAASTGGAIWDDETRLLYSLKAWREKRIATWQGNLPLMSAQVTLHAYRDPELIRVVSLGMRKFGLPDLVMSDVPPDDTRPAGNTLNALMQRLVEGGRPAPDRLTLRLADLRHTSAKASALTAPGKHATGAVMVSLTPVTPEPGDAANRLWSVDFPEAGLPTAPERQNWGFDRLFGSTDSIRNIAAHNERMQAASARARRQFFAQEARFRAGLAVGESLLVKKGFRSGEHTEFMWVQVTHWTVQSVEGILSSDPYFIKDLRAGMPVTVALDDVYDYILYRADGSTEGNETSKVLEAEGE